MDALALATLVCTGAAITLTGAGLATGGLDPAAVTGLGWVWLVALAMVSTVGAIALFFAGLRRVGPTAAAILSTLEPVVTVALAAAAFGEVLTAGPGRRRRPGPGCRRGPCRLPLRIPGGCFVSAMLEGRVALVAGATRGAGPRLAVALVTAGATVYCTGRTTRERRSEYDRPETIEDTAELVDAPGGTGIALPWRPPPAGAGT